MKFYKYLFIILVIFFKTGNVLSENNLFNVNNIEVINKNPKVYKETADQAIKKGFKELIGRILLKQDIKKLSNLNFSEIKELVSYYQISEDNNNIEINKINYNILFDKAKLHNLFYKREISYSDISNKELYLLPILKKNNQYFIYNHNYFYEKWNDVSTTNLIEFILPIENIEIIQKINKNKNNLLDLDLVNLFPEYQNKNLAFILIENNNRNEIKIFLKTRISKKKINKNMSLKKEKLSDEKFNEKIITEIKDEIINIVKSQNLVDISTPSFLNAKFLFNKKNNLVDLNYRLKKIDLIENVYVQELNNEYVFLKIKYLGKLDKITQKFEEQLIALKFKENEWNLKIK
jgi:hypothetical protein